jgi:hypothetical protein
VFLRLLPFILSFAVKQLNKRQAADAKRGKSSGRSRSTSRGRRR